MTSADPATTALRARRGRAAQRRGIDTESVACAVLEREGWSILGRRLRTAAGEVDAVAEKDGLLAVLEVKSRSTLALAAAGVTPRQRIRLLDAAAILLAANPGWGRNGIRFDVLLVDRAGTVRRIVDAFRQEA